MKRKVLLTVIALLSFSMSCSAQMGKLFNADNQLSSSFVNQVFLDRDGFIWAVTRNGLCRYDGYQYHLIRKEQGNGMASNYVICMEQDRNGLFYIGMFSALQTYDGVTFNDVRCTDLNGNIMPCYVTCFAERKDGTMLVGTSGHGVLMMDSPTSAHQIGGDLAKVDIVHDMMEDSHGQVWIVTDKHGVLVYDGQRVVQRYFADEPLCGSVRQVCEDTAGRFYVGMSAAGVYKQGDDGVFRHMELTGNRSVTDLYARRNGRVFIGFDGHGLGVYIPQADTLLYETDYSREVDLAKAKVVSAVEDDYGNLWYALLQKGVYVHPAIQTEFDYMGYKLGIHNIIGQACVTSALIDSRGRIYVGTDKDGLYVISSGKKPTLIRHYKENFPETILTMTEDNRGRVWLGTYLEGCGYIDPVTGQYHRQPLSQGRKISVFGIGADPQGRLWLGTMGDGLLRLSPDDGSVKAYKMKNGAVHDRKMNSLTNDFISKLSLSPDGKRVYLATTMGLCCYDIAADSWTSVFGANCLKYGTPMRVVKEYGGRLWLGTNDGLLCYDLLSRTMEQFASGSGLVDNGICSIEQDRRGRLWVSTDHGLCCHDPKTGRTESYFVDNGLQSNEFSDGASFTSSGGLMLFGGVGGVTWFDPAKINDSKWNATVKLTAFILNGKAVNPTTESDGRRVCDTTTIAANRFTLSYHDNTFTLRFSTLTYETPEHITYIYSINNEPEMRLRPGQNELTLSHLAPGTYHFSVKAIRNNQYTAERTFTVVVRPPWYLSWWAYCIYVAVIGLIVWQYLSNRSHREQNRLRLQEHIHAEEMGEAKLRFFINISHEIRTPMTLILTPLLSLMKQDTDPQRRSVYEVMRRNAERILSLINQIMDLRKIDKGRMMMRMQETDLVSFVGDIYSLFGHQARAKRINLRFEHDTEQLPIWIDRTNFDKVIVNILSNAFKFTPPGGEIVLRLTHDERQATIAISDNGEKIPEDKLERIFERFYQSPSSVNDRNVGTGIGLDLTRSLVELHHGTITARNLDKGCEFVVSILLGKDHLKPDEIMDGDEQREPDLHPMEDEEEPLLLDLSEERGTRKPLIVVAEDDDEIRDYLEMELGGSYDVRACRNGREALGEALKLMPDLVLSDVMMPEMDGNTLCTTLKTNPQTNHIPVVLLTAKNRDEDQLEGLETGADAYIVKPFNMDILRRTIINLITSRRQLSLKYSRNDKLEEKVDTVEMQSPDDKMLEKVMKVINQNLSNSDLSVDYIANQVGISRVHLHRKMKELTGQTPHDFIRNLRLKQAANLLASGNMNVTEVMYACGFGNAASFSTTFKKFYGMSPREYMQEHQEQKNLKDVNPGGVKQDYWI